MNITLSEVMMLSPVLYVLGAAFAVLVVDIIFPTKDGRREWVSYILQYICYAGLGLAIYDIVTADLDTVQAFANAVTIDAFYKFTSLIILFASVLTVLLSSEYIKLHKIKQGEYYALVLISAAGMMLLAAANDFITMFLSIELLSIALYILTGITRDEKRSNEAALKYFIMGAFATGFLLYGMALLYGASGTIYINELHSAVTHRTLAMVGLLLMIVGFAFKVGAVPFHMWVPDAYEGAPTSVTGFMAVTVKAAGFAVLARVVLAGVGGVVSEDILWGIAVLTMLAGNILALTQKSVKRMLAYSSIAHTGYAMIGIVVAVGVSGNSQLPTPNSQLTDAVASSLFYLFIYSFMTLGAFAFIIYAGRGGKDAEMYDDFSGLAKRHPWRAAAMALFMVSLAGVPPTAGFFGKFYLLKEAIEAKYYILAVVGVVATALSLYYYLYVLVMMYMKEPEAGATAAQVESGGATDDLDVGTAVFITAVFTLVLGIMPSFYLEIASIAAKALL